MHLHTLMTNVTIVKIVTELGKDRQPILGPTGKPIRPRFVKKGSNCVIDFKVQAPIACELYKDFKSLSTFTLRDEGLTLALGYIIKILN